MPHVFISYSNLDRNVANAAVAVLESRGVRCWIAPRDVTPGLDWSAEIVDAIEAASVMVLIFSSNANQSPQIKREIERGVARGIPVIPFRIEDVPLSKALEYFISSPHWLDAMSPPLERHLNYLADTVQLLLSRQSGGADATKLRKRMERRRRWGEAMRKVRMTAYGLAALVAVGAGAWAWGRFGTGAAHGNEPQRAVNPGLDSLLEAVRNAPTKGAPARQQSSTGATARTESAASGAVDPTLVGQWHSSATINGQIMNSTFLVTAGGDYRFENVTADSGRFVVQNGSYRLQSATGGQIVLREDRVDASTALLTGPLGTQQWHRVGFPTNSTYLIVGEWRTTAVQNNVPWQMTFSVDGRRWQYHTQSTSIDEGAITAHGGQWTTRSRTMNGTVANGTYIMIDDHTMSFTGPLGASTWTRQR